MATEILKLDQIYFSYGDEKLFDDFSFSVNSGETIAFKGESGTGKSTLLRLMMGFETPDEGTVYFRNEPLQNNIVRELRKEMAWLPQNLNIGRGNTAKVIEFPFTFKANKNKYPEDDLIQELLNELGLSTDILEKDFSLLSTGQRQRIGILICHLLERPLIFLDEPTSALDNESAKKAFKLLKKDTTRTIIFVSHDPVWLEHCDRVIEIVPVTASL